MNDTLRYDDGEGEIREIKEMREMRITMDDDGRDKRDKMEFVFGTGDADE